MIIADERGLDLTAVNATAVEHYDETIRRLLENRLNAADALKQTLTADAEFVMGHCLKGYFGMLAGTSTAVPRVRETLAFIEARLDGLTERERMHVAALRAWSEGDFPGADMLWDAILYEHPMDLLALRLQHFTTFWMGRSLALRDGVARVFGAWDDHTPGYSFVLGMYAFGLEEAGDYSRAEACGKRAVELNPDDMWAIHAVAHVLEMQSRLQDGMQWLDYPLDTWDDRNAMKTHLWWHLSLYPFERGDFDRVLELYDRAVCKEPPDFYIEIQNAASLLARLQLQGVDVGQRWQALADVCASRIDDHGLAFTDLHVMLALAAAGRHQDAERLLTSLQQFAETSEPSYMASTMQPVTIPLCQSMLALYTGNYATAVDLMLPIRYQNACVGGSHAQRDLFAHLLIEAALQAEQWHLARALLAERVAWRPNSRGSWLQYADVLDRLGQSSQAASARQRATAVEMGSETA